MITQLRGRLVEKSPTSVVIDCQGLAIWSTYPCLPMDS